jgi:hypothetical protein
VPLGCCDAGRYRRGAVLHAWAVAFTEDGQVDEYRGCTFVNAAAEYGQPDHPVRLMAVGQRLWINEVTERLLAESGHPEPQAAARALLALRTGYVSLLGWRRTPAGPNSSWPPTTGSSASAERYPRRLARWLCSCRSMP